MWQYFSSVVGLHATKVSPDRDIIPLNGEIGRRRVCSRLGAQPDQKCEAQFLANRTWASPARRHAALPVPEDGLRHVELIQ